MTSQLANPTANMTNLSSEQKRALLRRLLEEQRQPTPVEAELVPFLASFERQATEFPAVVAFVEGENQYTYQMLNQLANQLARHLQSSGIEKDAVVGVSLETSYELLLALLAIWKIGGVALLLESNWPVFYLQQQISSARPQLILTHSTQQARFSTVGCPLLALDSTMPGLREQPKENLGWLPSLSAVAYVTFPADKGVAVTQGAMATRLDWLSKQFAIDSADHFWHKTPLSDDAGLVELLLPLRCGGRVAGNLVSGAAISDNTTSTPNCPQEAALKLQRGLLEQQITIATFTNQELTLFLAHCNDSWAQQLPALRTIFCYNETPSQATIDRFCQQFDSALYVVFSLAEAAGEVFFSLCQPTTTLQRSALRQPTHIENPHCSIQICDEHLRSVPVGVKGEIVLRGRQMAQGYWQNDPATRMTFVEKHTETSADAAKSNGSKSNGVTSNGENHKPENHNQENGKPSSPPNTLRWLRTGETARLNNEGKLRQTGFSDGRIWHAGKIIDPQAIAAQIQQAPAVESAYVVSRVAADGVASLVAYVVAPARFSAERIHQFLAERLPTFLLPTDYTQIARLPLTRSGKVDSQLLAQLPVIEAERLKQWQASLQATTGVERAVVVTGEKQTEIARFHLSDLITDFHSTLQSQSEIGTVANLTVNPDRAAPRLQDTASRSLPVAICHGETLHRTASAPKVISEVLLKTALLADPKSIIYLQPDGSEKVQNYQQLLNDAQRVLGGLRAMGLQAGDKIIFQFDSNHDFICAFWACMLGGFVPVPLAIASDYSQPNTATLKLQNAWQLLNKPLIFTSERLIASIRTFAHAQTMSDCRMAVFEQCLLASPDPQLYASQPGDLALLALTSGSTGLPKAVMQSQQSLLSQVLGMVQMYQMSGDDVTFNWMPLDHVGGLIMLHLRDVYLGATQVQIATQVILQEPLKWLRGMDQYRATNTWAPNFAYGLISAQSEQVQQQSWDFSAMRYLMNGGEAIVPKSARRFLELLKPFGLSENAMQPAWGMSETSSGVIFSQNFRLDNTNDEDTFVDLGMPMPGFSIRIVDEQDQALAEGVIGRLQVQGASLTSGYYLNPEQNALAFTTDGWFNTGDLGYLRMGRLTLTGREKDVIIINGITYYSHDLEAVVEEVAGVAASFSAAVSVRSKESDSDKLALFFSPTSEYEHNLPKLCAEVRRYFIEKSGLTPTYLLPLDKNSIPKTEIGKIQRAKLRQRFVEGEFAEQLKQLDLQSNHLNTLPAWFFQKQWQPAQAESASHQLRADFYLLFADALGLVDRLCNRLQQMDKPYMKVTAGDVFQQLAPDHYQIRATDPKDYQHLLAVIGAERQNWAGKIAAPTLQVVHCWGYETDAPPLQTLEQLLSGQDRSLASLFCLIQALQQSNEAALPVRCLAVTNGAQSVDKHEICAPQKAAISALLRSAAQETPWLVCSHVDFPMAANSEVQNQLYYELSLHQSDPEVAYRQGQRLSPRLLQATPDSFRRQPLPFKRAGVYLLSGGLGGIGVEIARYLLSNFQARLLLVGRTPLPSEISLAIEDEPMRQRIAAYRSLLEISEKSGGDLLYVAADVCNPEQVDAAIAQASSRWQHTLDGVIHLAGSMRERLLNEETLAELAETLAPKVVGSWILNQAIQNNPEAIFIHIASVNGFLGGATVAAYSAANRFVDAFAAWQRATGRPQSYALAWSMWDEVGMSRNYAMKSLTINRGYHLLSAQQGIASFVAALQNGEPSLLIGLDASNPFIRSLLANNPLPHQGAPGQSLATQSITVYAQLQAGYSAERLSYPLLQDRFHTTIDYTLTIVDALPTTATGEVDMTQLLAQTKELKREGEHYAAPHSEAEQKLAKIWQELLRVPKVGIHDNFFALGGDSILGIQAIARANQMGLRLSAKDLFQYQTIAGLTSLVNLSTPVEAEQGAISGEVALLPIQQWFFEQPLSQPEHFNMSLILQTPAHLHPQHLATAVQQLMHHHDILRARYVQSPNGWRQIVALPSATPPFTVIDLAKQSAAERTAFIEGYASQRQSAFRLADDDLFQATWFDCGDDAGRLLLVVHHLLVDGVSWRILLEDLLTAYQHAVAGVPNPLPAKTTSFRAWGQRLYEHAQSPALLNELSFWRDQPWTQSARLPCDCAQDATLDLASSDLASSDLTNRDLANSGLTNSVGASASVTVALSTEQTQALLQELPRIYKSQINEILLTAMTQALLQWSGGDTLRIDLEGHGREALFADVELARTVGWFTTLFPLALTLAADQPPYSALQQTKEQLRSIPQNGIGYGLLRYLHPDAQVRAALAAIPAAQVSFNYLGQFDQVLGEESWKPAGEAIGLDRAAEDQRAYWFDVIGLVADGQLQLTWNYGSHLHTAQTVEKLAHAMLAQIQTLIAHSHSDAALAYIPSDFPLATLDADTLRQLCDAGERLDDLYPLSPMQEGMIFHSLFTADSSAYVEQFRFDLRGDLNVTALRIAWQQIVEQHAILRTAFDWDLTPPHQVVYRRVTLPWQFMDWSGTPQANSSAALDQFLQQDQQTGFNVKQAPLFRLTLIKTSAEAYTLVFTHHHALLDGWSIALIIKQLLADYSALSRSQQATAFPAAPYRDYIRWLLLQKRTAAQEFWQRQLQDFDTPTQLRIAKPDIQKGEIARSLKYQFQLSPTVTQAMRSLAQAQHITLSTLLQATWALLLSRYSGQDDVLFGVVVSGRPPQLPGIEEMVGLFINTLPVRVKTPGDAALLPWLQEVQQQQIEREQFSSSALVDLQKWSDVPAGTPLFESIIAFENYPIDDAVREQEGALQIENVHSNEQVHYPLTLVVMPSENAANKNGSSDGMGLQLQYASDHFSTQTIEQMARQLQWLLQQMTTRPTQRLADLSLVSPAEATQLLLTWNQTATDFPRDASIQQLFEAQVAHSPERIALCFADQQLTYDELNQRANQLARHLQQLGLPPQSIVALYMERSIELIIGMLGILKAGYAYLPLDRGYPPERLTWMLHDAQATVLLTQHRLRDSLPMHSSLGSASAGQPLHRIELDRQWDEIAKQPVDNPRCTSNGQSLAYLMYTSGSTGLPKGVAIPQRGVVRLVRDTNYVSLSADDVFLQLAPISFDAATFEIWGALLNGARLLVMPPQTPALSELGKAIRTQGVTILWLTSGLFTLMVNEQLDDLLTVRQLLAGGDVLPVAQVRRFMERNRQNNNHCQLINGYGPTENTTFSCCYPIQSADWEQRSVPIGRPIANTQVYILDQHRQLCPVGVAGELYIGGDGLAMGYWQRPELNAEKFMISPFHANSQQMLYRTGDLVRYLPDYQQNDQQNHQQNIAQRGGAEIEFLGRIDSQVKVRGFRIELSEIETTIARHPAVRNTVVVAHTQEEGHKQLVAYIVFQPDQPLTVGELQNFVKERLPEYMVPSEWLILEHLPLTPNGKLDRRALPTPNQRAKATDDLLAAPRNEIEAKLAEIWCKTLGQQQVGIDQNFFELGGDSIQALQIVARARHAGLTLTPALLFEYQTIAQLALVTVSGATVAAEQERVSGEVALTPIQHWFFAQQLPDSHHFNQTLLLDVSADLDLAALQRAFSHLLDHHDGLRLRFAEGDAGWLQFHAEEVEPFGALFPIQVVDLSWVSAERLAGEIEKQATQFQASLDITNGPLLRVVVLDPGLGLRKRMLIVVHHLIVDVVSWQILLEDLATSYEQALRGAALMLPAKSTSFKQWSQRLVDYSESPEAANEFAFWNGQPWHLVCPLPLDHSLGVEANRKSTSAQVTVKLSAAETAALAQQVKSVFSTDVDSVLLAALAQSVRCWQGSEAVLIEQERHGRVSLFEDVDLSRTVGWFTSIHPLLFDLRGTERPETVLRRVKEQLHTIPHEGIGYGILRHLSPDATLRKTLASLPQAQISFNYLGRLDQIGETTDWCPASESCGPDHSPLGMRPYLLEINGLISEGQLQMNWVYSQQLYQAKTIEGLAAHFVQLLQEIISYSQSPDADGVTPSDFPLANLDEQTLDKLSSLLQQLDME